MNFGTHLRLGVISALALAAAPRAHAQVDYTSYMALVGFGSGDEAGRSVDSAGDVNNDGFADYIVGVPRWASGRARVFSGRTGVPLYDITVAASAQLGRAVSGAGDVNNDGFDDFIVGSPIENSFAGATRVYSGAAGALLHTIAGAGAQQVGYAVSELDDVNNDGFDDFIVSYFGEPNGVVRVHSGAPGAPVLHTFPGLGGLFGFSADCAGDVNNDGVRDVVVGAPDESASAGVVRVYSGATGALLHTFTGAAGDSLGYSVAGAGEVNDDGFDDVIAGGHAAPNFAFTGVARVYSGATGVLLHELSGEPKSAFGSAVDASGDLDADGFDDFVVGAPLGGVGRATIFSGATGEVLDQFIGRSTTSSFGSALGGRGDLNGDGIPDLIVGSYRDDTNGTDAGAAFVYLSTRPNAPPPEPCPGDADGNRTVNFADITEVLTFFNATCP